jgi:REP element-mobilizing transposase RayT
MGGIFKNEDGQLIAAGGTADHVHLLVSIPPSVSVSDMLRKLKANSSKWIHETFPEHRGFSWQEGYGAFSVSQSNRTGWSLY